MPVYSRADHSFEERPNFPDRFIEFLIALQSIMRASVPLMRSAESECGQRITDEDRNLCVLLGKYYHEHSIEEKDHDEWLLNDLNSLGISREKILSQKPLPIVAELVGSQYYWIHHLHPAALLGYILVLEGYPLTQADLDRIMKKTGFPANAFRTLLEHSSLDVHHLKAG
jgi:pyrroloquinoline quinone (PQQ) biosynthesis protein C